MSLLVQCPACGEQFNLREARNEEAWREFVGVLLQVPTPVQNPLMQYLDLFRPAKQPSVRSGVLLSLTTELLPLIKAQQISRNRKHYDVPHSVWASAMTYLFSRRQTLQLPLKGNGYLLETIASQRERQEAKAEERAIVERRQGGFTPQPTNDFHAPLHPASQAKPSAASGGFGKLADLMRAALDTPQLESTHERQTDK